MHLLNGTFAVSKYTCESTIEQAPQDLADMLRKYSFKPIDNCAEEKSIGWVSSSDFLDSDFTMPPDLGGYLFFSLRMDTRKVNSAVFKKEVLLALKKEESLNQKIGKKFISRERKKELKEQVKIRLLSHTFPVPKAIMVAWNIPQQVLYFFSVNPKECDIFEEMFTRTFNMSLDKIDFYSVASGISSPSELDKLDTILSNQLISPDQSDGTYLGADFLNYLWFISDSQNSMNDANYSFFIGNSVTVSGEFGTLSAKSTAGELAEAMYGLVNGKKVSSLTFSIETSDAATYKAKLDGSYRLSGVKLPRSEKLDDAGDDALLLEKLFLLEQLFSYVDEVFGVFLKIRLTDNQWRDISVKIELWANKKEKGPREV
jgi:Putative exonuclease, RdgC.